MPDPRSELARLRERIENSTRDPADLDDPEDCRAIDDPADCEILLKFSNRLDLLREQYGAYRHLKLLRHCTRMAEHVGGLADALEDRDAAEAIVRWINTEYDPDDPTKDISEETNRDYRVALRIFGKRVTDEEGLPESLAWVTATYSNSYDPTPDPAKMLEWDEDVKPMIEAARNSRDKALIAVQFDGGFRGGELYDMTIGAVSDGTHSMKIRVDGKTGQRSVDLIPSIPYLNRWLADHPASDDPAAPLWCKLDVPDRYSYTRFLKSFKEPGERAGVEKPVTPTNFRKSSATWLAKQGASESYLNIRQGRKQGSKITARYVAEFGGEDAEAMYAKLHGIDIETEDEEDLVPIECPRCGKETPHDESTCVWCHQALSPTAIEAVDDQEGRFVSSAADAEGDLAQSVVELRELFQKHPSLRAAVLDK